MIKLSIEMHYLYFFILNNTFNQKKLYQYYNILYINFLN